MDDQPTHNCDSDKQLAETLHRLFIVEGNEEVSVIHPVDGEQVMTRKYYLELQESLKKAKNMSPAERLVETKRLKNKKQMQFRTAMIEAKVYVVDIESDEPIGFDVDGNKMDIEISDFVPVAQYISGIELKENEIGCFVSESLQKPPVRIVKQVLLEKDK